MRKCQRDRRKFLVGQKTDVILTAQQRRNVVCFARSFDGANAVLPIDLLEVAPLV